MADGVGHLADLPRASFVDRHPQHRRVALGAPFPQQFDERRARAAALDDDTAREALDVVRVGHAKHHRFVHALDLVARMGERGGQIAVVGQDEQPLGVEIEAPDGIDVFAHPLSRSSTVGRCSGSERVVT